MKNKTRSIAIITLFCALTLSACNPKTDPLSKVEDAVSDSDSTTQVQKSLESSQQETGAAPDLSADKIQNQSEINVPSVDQDNKLPTKEIEMTENVTLKTSKGDVKIKLYPEVAPETVKNFLEKATSDYYKGLTFHRVEDWVVQGGDPLGNGTGGGKIKTELSDTPFVEGSLGVARGGDIRVSNDSQFFFCTKDCGWLTGQYTNFGEVVEGMDIIKSMEVGDTIVSITPIES